MAKKQDYATNDDVKILKTDVKKIGKTVKRLEKAINGNTKAINRNGKELLSFKWVVDKRFINLEEKMKKMFTDLKNYMFNLIDPTMKELETMRQE